MMATVLFRRGATAEAVELAEGVRAEHPDNVAANMVLFAERLAAGAYEEALERVDAAL